MFRNPKTHIVFHLFQLLPCRWINPGAVEMACVVGNAAVAIAMGGHILFVNLKTTAKSYYSADGVHTGNGVACIAGHKLFPIVAFAERCTNPRILLVSYPANTVLSILEGGGRF